MRGHQLTSPARWRAMTALLLLAPGTPMLFQGQEFSASAPFLYFADHDPELAEAVRKGRAEFLTQFPSIVDSRRAGARRPRRSGDLRAVHARFDRAGDARRLPTRCIRIC